MRRDSCAASLGPRECRTHRTRWPAACFRSWGEQENIGGGTATFLKQRALAKAGWSLSFIERPGFGLSPSWGVDDMQRDAGWISSEFEPLAHVNGHSWGGALALLAAVKNPKTVRLLTLIEPALQLPIIMSSFRHSDCRINHGWIYGTGLCVF